MIGALRSKLGQLALAFTIGGHVIALVDLLADYIALRLREDVAPAPDTSPVLLAPAPDRQPDDGELCTCKHDYARHQTSDGHCHTGGCPCRMFVWAAMLA